MSIFGFVMQSEGLLTDCSISLLVAYKEPGLGLVHLVKQPFRFEPIFRVLGIKAFILEEYLYICNFIFSFIEYMFV